MFMEGNKQSRPHSAGRPLQVNTAFDWTNARTLDLMMLAQQLTSDETISVLCARFSPNFNVTEKSIRPTVAVFQNLKRTLPTETFRLLVGLLLQHGVNSDSLDKQYDHLLIENRILHILKDYMDLAFQLIDLLKDVRDREDHCLNILQNNRTSSSNEPMSDTKQHTGEVDVEGGCGPWAADLDSSMQTERLVDRVTDATGHESLEFGLSRKMYNKIPASLRHAVPEEESQIGVKAATNAGSSSGIQESAKVKQHLPQSADVTECASLGGKGDKIANKEPPSISILQDFDEMGDTGSEDDACRITSTPDAELRSSSIEDAVEGGSPAIGSSGCRKRVRRLGARENDMLLRQVGNHCIVIGVKDQALATESSDNVDSDHTQGDNDPINNAQSDRGTAADCPSSSRDGQGQTEVEDTVLVIDETKAVKKSKKQKKKQGRKSTSINRVNVAALCGVTASTEKRSKRSKPKKGRRRSKKSLLSHKLGGLLEALDKAEENANNSCNKCPDDVLCKPNISRSQMSSSITEAPIDVSGDSKWSALQIATDHSRKRAKRRDKKVLTSRKQSDMRDALKKADEKVTTAYDMYHDAARNIDIIDGKLSAMANEAYIALTEDTRWHAWTDVRLDEPPPKRRRGEKVIMGRDQSELLDELEKHEETAIKSLDEYEVAMLDKLILQSRVSASESLMALSVENGKKVEGNVKGKHLHSEAHSTGCGEQHDANGDCVPFARCLGLKPSNEESVPARSRSHSKSKCGMKSASKGRKPKSAAARTSSIPSAEGSDYNPNFPFTTSAFMGMSSIAESATFLGGTYPQRRMTSQVGSADCIDCDIVSSQDSFDRDIAFGLGAFSQNDDDDLSFLNRLLKSPSPPGRLPTWSGEKRRKRRRKPKKTSRKQKEPRRSRRLKGKQSPDDDGGSVGEKSGKTHKTTKDCSCCS